MEKKKVLFIMPSMFIGGAERSLLGLLDSFDYSKYDVSLFLYRHEGEFMEYIPKQVNVIPEIDKYRTFDVPIKSLLFGRKFAFGCARLLGKFAKSIHSKLKKEPAGVWMNMQYISRFILPLLPNIPGKYDLAVMFLGVADVLLKKVTAQKKVAWSHIDYSSLGPDIKYDRKIYNELDYIVHVSDSCKKCFLDFYPEYYDKTKTIENILSVFLLNEQSKEQIDDFIKDQNEILLLSVGRFSAQKNFENVPIICKYIVERGISVKWGLIGYGGEEQRIRDSIQKYHMQDIVVVLGKKINPYPYIRNCDIYIQPSLFEGKAVTVREAQTLHKPVIITNYATSSSQLTDGIDGIIVSMDNEGCAEGIIKVIQDKKLQRKLIENTKKTDYSNKQEIEKIYQLID